jgi:hypothetical protein
VEKEIIEQREPNESVKFNYNIEDIDETLRVNKVE